MRIALAAAVLVLLVAATPSQPVTVPDYASIRNIGKYATAGEYERARTDSRFSLTRAAYRSGELTVYAYVYAPATAPAEPLPVVIFNRGSYTWKEFAGEYLTTFHRLAEAGFIVVAPMYRGSGGADGRDELGGADLDDLLNVTALLAAMPHADARRLFLYGESRGAMMVYQAIRERFPARAAATYGGFTDLALLTAPGAKFAGAAAQIWPDYAERKKEIDERRSAVRWASAFSIPVLIMHGGADTDVDPSHALALASRLEELDKSYELVIRAGENHVLTGWRAERDAQAVAWFRKHM